MRKATDSEVVIVEKPYPLYALLLLGVAHLLLEYVWVAPATAQLSTSVSLSILVLLIARGIGLFRARYEIFSALGEADVEISGSYLNLKSPLTTKISVA